MTKRKRERERLIAKKKRLTAQVYFIAVIAAIIHFVTHHATVVQASPGATLKAALCNTRMS